MRLVWGEITPAGNLPDFGAEFRQHMLAKKNPSVYAASLTAWRLLAGELIRLGLPLPEVAFAKNGKPYFKDFSLYFSDLSLQNSNFSLNLNHFSSNFSLYFSISHSENIAAALLSDVPCGVDVEIIRPKTAEKLFERCMHPAEISAGLDFFDVWTAKECIAKLIGSGLPSRPCEINSLEYSGIHRERVFDSQGNAYALCTFQAK